MKRTKRCSGIALFAFAIFFLIGTFWCVSFAEAFEPGKTYDSSNWQEIKDIVIPQMLNWIKNGETKITTGKLNYEYKHND